MKQITVFFVALMVCSGIAAQEKQTDANPSVIIHTSQGDITVELYADKAPISTENFLAYVNSGFYDGTIFHRVISHFMIQGGGFTPDMTKKVPGVAITNEANNGLSNTRGTLAMARTNNPHSATAQFFINVQDNFNLDHTGENNARTWGYAVFGKVSDGMDVVDQIRFMETVKKPPYSDVPKTAIIIESVEIISSTEG
jgi:cyclophilin family peptidyl-prolyl cis-trans isomerase